MKNKEVTFAPYDTAEFLRTPQEIADYLETVFEEYGTDSRAVVRALGTAARAVGMQKIADATGLQRQGLYKSLSDEGNPSFDTILRVMNAVGVELRPKAKPETRRSRYKVRVARKKSLLRAGKAAA